MGADFLRAPAPWKGKNGRAAAAQMPNNRPITNFFARRVETATHRLCAVIRGPALTRSRAPRVLSRTLSLGVTLENEFRSEYLNWLRANRTFQLLQVIGRANLVQFHAGFV